MNKKTAASILVLFVGLFLHLLLNSCGSDDNNDFNIYFVGLGTDTNQNFYDNDQLQKIVSNDLASLNQKWQTSIINEKEALREFDGFCVYLEKKLEFQVREDQILINGTTYFTLVLSHSVKHGQDYPEIATYKVSLSTSE